MLTIHTTTDPIHITMLLQRTVAITVAMLTFCHKYYFNIFNIFLPPIYISVLALTILQLKITLSGLTSLWAMRLDLRHELKLSL